MSTKKTQRKNTWKTASFLHPTLIVKTCAPEVRELFCTAFKKK